MQHQLSGWMGNADGDVGIGCNGHRAQDIQGRRPVTAKAPVAPHPEALGLFKSQVMH